MRTYIRLFGAISLCLFLLTAVASLSYATVQVTGNVWQSPDATVPDYMVYAENPFTPEFEGIPLGGNRVDPFRSPTGTPPLKQIEYEGRPVDLTGTVNDTNINFDIIVGRTSFGELKIDASTLRDQNLIIGDQAMIGSVLKRGSGTVRIEGFGGTYNNDPTIIPYLGEDFQPDPDNPVSPSVVPRLDNIGFDLYVGRAGNGVLQIALSGRAEIQDAAIVGDGSGSVGTLVIDGVDSFLQSGGFQVDNASDDEVHYMIVGRIGSGTMRIINGGQSYNVGPSPATGGGGGDVVFGAVLGSNFAADDTNPPAPGGQGTVYVDGTASKWTVGGNLQVGGFHDQRDGSGINSPEDLEGNEAEYASGVGRGTLNVSNGALVSIITPPIDDTASNVPNRLDLLVGRFGQVNLEGGRIELLGAFDASNPQNPTQQLTNGRLINDGVVSGDGSISVLQFRNRVLGEVRVGANQKLLVESTGSYLESDNIPVNSEPEYPLSNYGLIEVLGTETARAEVEFDRNQVTNPTATDFTRPFLNLQVPLPLAPNGHTEGKILGQDSILRFRSGLNNFADLTITGGTNVVAGNIRNEIGGTIFIDGNGTTVTFEDRVDNFGHFELGPNISLITINSDFMMGGTASISTLFGGRPTGQEVSYLSTVGDMLLDGLFTASLFTAPGVPSFSPQPGDTFEIFHAAGELTGDFSAVILPGCVTATTCFVSFPDYALDSYFIQAFAPLAAGNGADFNNDGIVNDVDLQIWRQNLGGPGPAGDANGDGIVNGLDFFVWQDQVGTPGMPPGAGSGGGAGLGAVPEPTSLALVAAGGLLALAWRRRRSN